MCWTLKIVTFPRACCERFPFSSPCLKTGFSLVFRASLIWFLEGPRLGPLQVLALKLAHTLVSSDIATFQVRVLTILAGLGWLCLPGKL